MDLKGSKEDIYLILECLSGTDVILFVIIVEIRFYFDLGFHSNWVSMILTLGVSGRM